MMVEIFTTINMEADPGIPATGYVPHYAYPTKPMQAPLEYTREFVHSVDVAVPAEVAHPWYATTNLRWYKWPMEHEKVLQQQWKRIVMRQGHWKAGDEETEWRNVPTVSV